MHHQFHRRSQQRALLSSGKVPALLVSAQSWKKSRLMPQGVIPQVRNFVFVVIDHRRIQEFASIVEAFEVFLDERLGFIRADVSSAPGADGRFSAGSWRWNFRVPVRQEGETQVATDPALLLAGVVARVGSVVYDGSVRGQLVRMRAKLANG